MGQWWRYALRLIAVIAAAAPAVMNVAGCFESFTNPYIRYFAAGVGACADVYLLASLPAFAHIRQKRREWAFKVGLAIWLACFLWTGLSSGSWLKHALEAAQAPVEQQKQTQEKTEADRQADLTRERETLKGDEETARTGKTKDIRENAAKLAAETRGRIKELEKLKTSAAETEAKPIKSPFSGCEKLVTFLLLAFSQGCWFMALDAEPEEVAGSEIGKLERAEIPAGNDAPAFPKPAKRAGAGSRKSTGNANVIKFRKRPTKEEILAFQDRNLRNFLNEKPRSQAA
jgi:hypothetical protein